MHLQTHLTQSQNSGIAAHSVADTALLNEKQAAAVLGVSVAQVRKWRLGTGRGPKFVKIGTSVRYRADHLRQFIDALPVRGGVCA